jgi:hypothetical protein
MLQRHKIHSDSVCLFSSLPLELFKSLEMPLLVFKRGNSLGPTGAYHSSDIPEFYGSSASPDFIGTDAVGMFQTFLIIDVV